MKKAFTLVEIMIIIAIIALLAAISIPNLMKARCQRDCANGECSDTCKQYLNPHNNNGVLDGYDMNDVEVFCNMIGVSTYDFSRSKSLRNCYEEFQKGNFNPKVTR